MNDDPNIHSRSPSPIASDIVDRCIECGFCESNCRARPLTHAAPAHPRRTARSSATPPATRPRPRARAARAASSVVVRRPAPPQGSRTRTVPGEADVRGRRHVPGEVPVKINTEAHQEPAQGLRARAAPRVARSPPSRSATSARSPRSRRCSTRSLAHAAPAGPSSARSTRRQPRVGPPRPGGRQVPARRAAAPPRAAAAGRRRRVAGRARGRVLRRARRA